MKKGESLARYRAKRDFTRTAEPSGAARRGAAATEGPRFVIQKHAASHLHYDLRLEVRGVMKSWAVPKGPSMDPAVRRLAMEVEDHPIAYNLFEGTIPQGEYGGGTVMLWDRGSYTADEKKAGESDEKAMARGYRKGKLDFSFHGERLRGSFTLVRTRGAPGGERSQWLLIKHQDDFASEKGEITKEYSTSVTTGRTMDEIAAGEGGGRVWHSNHDEVASEPTAKDRRNARPPALPAGLEPMLARSGGAEPQGEGWTFEPKYDGIRTLAFATEGGAALVTRNGNEKSAQFPEVAAALRDLAISLGEPVVLDGEIVALEGGRIVRFEALQGRMHVKDARRVARLAEKSPAALVVFDLLLAGDEVLMPEPWAARRERLESLLDGHTGERIILGETSGNRAALLRRAEREGWEGLIAKRTEAAYRPGSRSGEWVKLKIEHQQEFVVGGWTEPRRSRSHIGALLLGYYRDGKLIYAGHTGTGFNRDSLADMMRRLKPLARKTPPFSTRPSTNEPAHWVRPSVVVEVRFNEWTSDGKLRQPVFLGVREDKEPKSVVREEEAAAEADTERSEPTRSKIRVTSPKKVFFPDVGVTKGELVGYYESMADRILPWMRDRPLVLKRYPDGIEGEAFYQQAAPERVPAGVRVEKVKIEGEARRRLVGGDLETLLYTIQIGAISYDPWHSRVGDLTSADYSIIDLDPGPGAGFERVVEVALRVKEELDDLGLHGAIKTSGSRGIHIYLPLPPETPLEAATLVAQIVATRTARKHPKLATIERMTKRRPRGTVYVDYLQNILGKTVAGVYAVRAKPGATVSTPIRWEELAGELRMEAFTVRTVAARVAEVGDLWTPEMERPNSLEALIREGADQSPSTSAIE